jgi:hypothetical protein
MDANELTSIFMIPLRPSLFHGAHCVNACALAALLAVAVAATAAAATPEAGLATRQAQLACGRAIVYASAVCHGVTALCLRETLTFRRVEGSTTLAPHAQTHSHPAPGGGSVTALDYRATSWTCAPGTNGGRYVAVVMVRAGGADCGECQYLRLYHPNGSLVAATLKFDAAGQASGNEKGAILVQKVLGRPWPEGLKLVYDR